jgi:hypothetical protein
MNIEKAAREASNKQWKAITDQEPSLKGSLIANQFRDFFMLGFTRGVMAQHQEDKAVLEALTKALVDVTTICSSPKPAVTITSSPEDVQNNILNATIEMPDPYGVVAQRLKEAGVPFTTVAMKPISRDPSQET